MYDEDYSGFCDAGIMDAGMGAAEGTTGTGTRYLRSIYEQAELELSIIINPMLGRLSKWLIFLARIGRRATRRNPMSPNIKKYYRVYFR